MSRIIKFRGRNITTGEWVFGCLVNNLWAYSEHHSLHGQPVCEIITVDECDDYGDMEDKELNKTVDPVTVGQLAGLLDKNGKDIYEGDIMPMKITAGQYGRHLFTGDVTLNGFVEYDAIRARFKISFSQPNEGNIISTEFGWGGESFEVIGNIHEHKQLINKG